jgi:hypothetical protein
MCTVQAVVVMYTSYSCVIAWTLMCYELLQKQVLRMKSYERPWRKHLRLFGIIALPIIPVGYFGGNGTHTHIHTHVHRTYTLLFFSLNHLLCLTISFGYLRYGGTLLWRFYNISNPNDIDLAPFYL